jgi:hypothetical protein
MDRHTSTGKQPKQRKKKRNRQQTRQEEKKYKCTCHVYGQTHQYGGKEQESEPKKRNWNQDVQCRWKRSTSAPVTSMDRHTSTKSWQKVSEARTSRNEPKKERKTKQRFRAVFLDLSELKFCAENLDLGCAVWMREKYECTCHVYGQTHKYSVSLKNK